MTRNLFLGPLAAITSAIFGLALVLTPASGSEPAGAHPPGPVKPVLGAIVTQGFGCTSYQFEAVDRACPGGHWHSGIDLATAAGTPVHSILAGIATIVISPAGYGLHVIVDHGGGLTSLYGHLSIVSVHQRDHVEAGDIIGAVGSTGNSTGPHLHFEIRRDGIPEDPRRDLPLP